MVEKRGGRPKTLFAVALAGLLLMAFMAPALADNAECQGAGDTNLTANYINEVPDEEITVTCDIGIFFDQRGSIDGVTVKGSVDKANSNQFGIYILGANVDITNSEVAVEEGYSHEFVSVSFHDGAAGNLRDNDVTGAHRVGVLARGENTSVNIRNNSVIGTGAKTSGWAENGIQIDQGAHASVVNNVINDHFWADNDWSSTGILVLTSDLVVQRNTITGGDMGVWVQGNNNNVIHNSIETSADGDVGIWNDGLFINGDNNGVRQNTIVASREDNDDIGIWVFGANNKLIRNNIEKFGGPDVWDDGEDTKRPKPFSQ